MIRLTIVCLMALSLLLGGCAATKEEVASYHESVKIANLQVIETVQVQANHNAQRRIDSMVYFSKAMTEAAKTPDPSDNATIAFAWGFVTAQPDKIEVPSLQYPRAPVTSVDALKAWTPIVGMTIPLIQPLLYGYGVFGDGGGSQQDIVATDNATIYLDSGNTNSQNAVRDGSSFDGSGANTTNQHDDNLGGSESGVTPFGAGECPAGLELRESTGTCITPSCAATIEGGGSDSCDAGVTPVTTATPTASSGGGESCETTGGYLGLDGRLYANPNFTCSCGSREEGRC